MRSTVITTAAITALIAAVAVAAPAHSPAHASSTQRALDDATIVAIFDAANTADIETGTLAATRGSTKEVRDFGAMLERDHKAVRQQGRDLAKKLGVVPTPPKDDPSAAAHAAAMKLLASKSGKDFDTTFLRHEATYHKAVIDAVTSTLLPAIKNAELKALVVKVAPAFEAHMKGAESLLAKVAK
jgi:putative membrane protein